MGPGRLFSDFLSGQKSCRTKVPRISRISVPNFAPNFAPNFPEIFEDFSCFVSWETETRKKIHQKSPPFFNAKFPGKHEKNIHKMFLESRQSNFLGFRAGRARETPVNGQRVPKSGTAWQSGAFIRETVHFLDTEWVIFPYGVAV